MHAAHEHSGELNRKFGESGKVLALLLLVLPDLPVQFGCGYAELGNPWSTKAGIVDLVVATPRLGILRVSWPLSRAACNLFTAAIGNPLYVSAFRL